MSKKIDPNDAFREVLAVCLVRKRLKKSHIAKLIGVSSPSVFNWEKNPDVITLANLRKLCAALNVNDKQLCSIFGIDYNGLTD